MNAEIIKTIYLAFKERMEANESWYGDRDYLFMKLYIETGERPGALLKAKINHFDLEEGSLCIPASDEKTRRAKYYVLQPETCDFIRRYFEKRKKIIEARQDRVFFSNEKRGAGHIQEGHFNQSIYTPILKKLGLDNKIKYGSKDFHKYHLYSIRAGVFTYLHKDLGYNSKVVQQQSQHSDVITLERFYLKYERLECQKVLSKELTRLTKEPTLESNPEKELILLNTSKIE
jgi:integrase